MMDEPRYCPACACAFDGLHEERCPECGRLTERSEGLTYSGTGSHGSSLSRKLEGFIVVIALITLACWWLGGRVICRGQRARVVLAIACVGSEGPIATALDQFNADLGRYPSSTEGLEGLVAADYVDERFQGPYLDREALRDPWGNPFCYRCPGLFNPTAYDLWSYGPNGRDDGGRDTEDDITN